MRSSEKRPRRLHSSDHTPPALSMISESSLDRTRPRGRRPTKPLSKRSSAPRTTSKSHQSRSRLRLRLFGLLPSLSSRPTPVRLRSTHRLTARMICSHLSTCLLRRSSSILPKTSSMRIFRLSSRKCCALACSSQRLLPTMHFSHQPLDSPAAKLRGCPRLWKSTPTCSGEKSRLISPPSAS